MPKKLRTIRVDLPLSDAIYEYAKEHTEGKISMAVRELVKIALSNLEHLEAQDKKINTLTKLSYKGKKN